MTTMTCVNDDETCANDENDLRKWQPTQNNDDLPEWRRRTATYANDDGDFDLRKWRHFDLGNWRRRRLRFTWMTMTTSIYVYDDDDDTISKNYLYRGRELLRTRLYEILKFLLHSFG